MSVLLIFILILLFVVGTLLFFRNAGNPAPQSRQDRNNDASSIGVYDSTSVSYDGSTDSSCNDTGSDSGSDGGGDGGSCD